MADLIPHRFRQRRLQRAAKFLNNMSIFDNDTTDFKLIMSLIRGCDKLEMLANEQLQRELTENVEREEAAKYVDGVTNSPLFQKLPMEIRTHIWSYLVVVPESIHIYPVKQNVKQGFRLSRCGEAAINLNNGWCNCSGDGLSANATPPVYLDTELLLVFPYIPIAANLLMLDRYQRQCDGRFSTSSSSRTILHSHRCETLSTLQKISPSARPDYRISA
jgi:hypothetical protein